MPAKRKANASSSATKLKTAAAQSKKARISTGSEKSYLEKLYGMPMSDELFMANEFFSTKSNQDFLYTLKLKLVGPFHYLAEKKTNSNHDPSFYHMQWRYFYDVPEFLTVIVSTEKDNLFHVGYLRDEPTDVDSAVVVSNSGKTAKYTVLGDNILAAISSIAADVAKASKNRTEKKKLTDFLEELQKFAKKYDLDLSGKSSKVKQRERKFVAKTFHGAGIIVPLSADGIGYRPLHHTDAQLKKLLQKIVDAKNDNDRITAFDPIQEMVNFIQFANDECDYGMGLELGIDLFCNGSKYFHKMSKLLLTVAYQLLKRDLYGTICEKHLADRREKDVERI